VQLSQPDPGWFGGLLRYVKCANLEVLCFSTMPHVMLVL
jgi:hypothetical protein